MIYGVDVSHNLQECKLAKGRPGNHGYHRKSYKNVVYLAHRLSYMLTYGDPPQGYEIHHLCHNRRCIEPTHLVALTKAEHQLQEIRERGLVGMSKIHAAKTRCDNGHEFDGHNSKQRTCSICSKAIKKRWRENHREQYNNYRRAYRAKLKLERG